MRPSDGTGLQNQPRLGKALPSRRFASVRGFERFFEAFNLSAERLVFAALLFIYLSLLCVVLLRQCDLRQGSIEVSFREASRSAASVFD